jgi:nicotinate-nucleotide adenylyltransferase
MEPNPVAGKRVAFFGGSFDPPHQGHLAVARAARTALSLDTVLFAPVGAQPLKPWGSTAGYEDRVAMTRLAIAADPAFAVSLTDAPKPHASPNYTLDTLVRLRAEFPSGGALFCLMGADSFFSLRRWHRAAQIPFVAPLIVASRPGQPLDDLRAALPQGITMDSPPEASGIPTLPLVLDPELRTCLLRNEAGEASLFYLLSGLHLDISASHIRDLIHHPILAQARNSPSTTAAEPDLLPLAVLDYIRSHQLYR